MSFGVFYSDGAERQVKKLDKSIRIQVMKKIECLKYDPEIGRPLGNVFKNYRSLHVGKFRVIYLIKEEVKQVIVAAIKHRKHAYRVMP